MVKECIDNSWKEVVKGIEFKGKELAILEALLESEIFLDDENKLFGRVEVVDHQEILPQNRLVSWVQQKCAIKCGVLVNEKQIIEILKLVETLIQGTLRVKLNVRIGEADGCIYYNLEDEKRRVVKIEPGAWSVIEKSPILFKSTGVSSSQVIPKSSGDGFDKLLKYINLDNKDDELLFLVWLVSCFIPNKPHVIMALCGDQGSAKSTTQRILKRIVDPSLADVQTMADNKRDLVVQLASEYVPSFDNISSITTMQSDQLCRAATGGSIIQRELYSNGKTFILNIHRCILLNGISLGTMKADLMDRTIIFKQKRILPEKRKGEQELWNDFEKDVPDILGAVMDTLAKAMEIYPAIRLKGLERMADFCAWGYAIAEAMGDEGESFYKVYKKNIGMVVDEIISENPVAITLVDMMKDHQEWNGSMAALLDKLNHYARKSAINTRIREWPQLPNMLSSEVKRLIPALRDFGIDTETYMGTAGKNKGYSMVKLTRTNQDISNQNIRTNDEEYAKAV